MKTLDRLIQISAFELDQARQKLVDLQAAHDDLANQVMRLDSQMADEMTAARDDPALTASIGNYLRATRARQATLRASMRDLEAEIEPAREVVSEAFRENKRFTHVRDNRLAEVKKRRQRREQEDLDEMGLQLTRRKNSG